MHGCKQRQGYRHRHRHSHSHSHTYTNITRTWRFCVSKMRWKLFEMMCFFGFRGFAAIEGTSRSMAQMRHVLSSISKLRFIGSEACECYKQRTAQSSMAQMRHTRSTASLKMKLTHASPVQQSGTDGLTRSHQGSTRWRLRVSPY